MSSSYKYMPYYESTYHLIYKLENVISYSTTYITLMPYSAKIVTLCHVTTLQKKIFIHSFNAKIMQLSRQGCSNCLNFFWKDLLLSTNFKKISIIFLVHIATKSDEFLSDKEKHLSQENNICSPPSSQQHCSPYYPKPPSRCGSHSESLNGSSSGKP